MNELALTSEITKVSLSQKMRRLGFDPWLLLILLGLVSYGLVMVYSASWDVSWRLHQDASALFRKQLSNLGLALAAMLVAARLPLGWLRKLALPVIVIAILALMGVLLIGGTAADIPRRSFVGGSIQMDLWFLAADHDHRHCGRFDPCSAGP
jgi:cell division protein FtsW (lipid II flippase)